MSTKERRVKNTQKFDHAVYGWSPGLINTFKLEEIFFIIYFFRKDTGRYVWMVFETENFQMRIWNHVMINFLVIYEKPMTQKCKFFVRLSKCQRSLRNHTQNFLVFSWQNWRGPIGSLTSDQFWASIYPVSDLQLKPKIAHIFTTIFKRNNKLYNIYNTWT